jgi:hypothetical protein
MEACPERSRSERTPTSRNRFSAFLNRSEPRYAGRHFARHAKKGGYELLIDIGNAFILNEVSFAMRSVEHTPLFRGKLQGMRKRLEHEITIVRPITVPAQRGESACAAL